MRPDGCLHAGEEQVDVFLEAGDEERLLALEVQRDGRGGEPGVSRHGGETGAGDPVSEEGFSSGLHDRLPGVGGSGSPPVAAGIAAHGGVADVVLEVAFEGGCGAHGVLLCVLGVRLAECMAISCMKTAPRSHEIT